MRIPRNVRRQWSVVRCFSSSLFANDYGQLTTDNGQLLNPKSEIQLNLAILASENSKSRASLRPMAAKVNYNAVAMKRRYVGCATAVSLCGLVLYTVTLLPDIDWSEGARAQLNAYLGRVSSMAGGYPLYFWLGFLFSRFPGVDPAWSINFSSALYGAAALFFFVLVGFEILESMSDNLAGLGSNRDRETEPSTPPASAENVPARRNDGAILSYGPVFLASISLALSSTFWFCSTHPRPVSLNGVVLMAALYCAVGLAGKPGMGTVFSLCLILGLSAAVHWMTLLLSPIFLATIVVLFRAHRVKLTKASLLGAAGGLALGLLPFLVALLHDLALWQQPVLVLALASRMPLGASHPWAPEPVQMMKEAAFFSSYNFFPWGIAIGIVGMLRLLRRRLLLFLLLGGCFVSAALLSFIASGPDRAIHYQPAWMLFALFLVPGWHYLLKLNSRLIWPAALVVLLIPPVVYQYAARSFSRRPPLTLVISSDQRGAESAPYSHLNPSGRGDHSARNFGERLLGRLPPHARLLAYYRVDSSTYPILGFLQRVNHLRPDVSVDELRGYDGPVSLRHLFQLHPEIQTVYLAEQHPLYEVAGTEMETPGAGSDPESRLVAIKRTDSPAATTSLKPESSNWCGYMTLLEPTLGLRAIWQDDLWFIRLRFSNPALYPHEARVDHLRVEPGSVSFTYAGFNFAGKIFGNTILGEWWVSSDPEFHGEWLCRKK